MSLDAALVSLYRDLAGLKEVVSALRDIAVEDQPTRGAVVLADGLEDLLAEFVSALDEADAHAARALRREAPRASPEEVQALVRDIHALLNRVTDTYVTRLASHDHIARLLTMGRERGPRWYLWSREVKTAIERCGRPMQAVSDTMVECWMELADRRARSSVSLQTIGGG